jgi:valyl-tRNA synthetase
VHLAAWPAPAELTSGTAADVAAGEALIDAVCGTLALIRRAKTEAKVSQRAAVALAVVSAPAAVVAAVRAGWADIADAGSVADAEFVERDGEIAVTVTLAPVG